MRRLLGSVLLSVLAAGPIAARADGSIQLNARAGVAKPFGDVGDGEKLTDTIEWAFPLDAQLQFRILKQLSIGAYGRFAPTVIKSSCSGCTASDIGFGGVVEYRFSGRLEGGPWIAASVGYEMLRSEAPVPATSAKAKATLSGLEGAVSAGADFELGGLTLGPFLQLSMGQFSKVKDDAGSASIGSKGVHGFFGGGVRLTLLL